MTTCTEVYGNNALECKSFLTTDDKLQLCLKTVKTRPDWILFIITILITLIIIYIGFKHLYNKGYIKFVKK